MDVRRLEHAQRLWPQPLRMNLGNLKLSSLVTGILQARSESDYTSIVDADIRKKLR